MSDDKQTLKAVPVRRRSAARLAAVQIIYQALITGQSAINFAPQFLAHYAGDVAKSFKVKDLDKGCLLYTSPSPRDGLLSRMPSSA